jgi:hypothetical protein
MHELPSGGPARHARVVGRLQGAAPDLAFVIARQVVRVLRRTTVVALVATVP